MEWTLSGFNSCLPHYFRQFVLLIVKFTTGLEKDLQKKTSKSESKSESITLKSKSKSGKNGLESGLESKSGLEYYKSGFTYARCATCRLPTAASNRQIGLVPQVGMVTVTLPL